MSLESFAGRIEKWIHAIGKVFIYVSAGVLFLMMIFISCDVVARYVFKHAIAGSVDYIIVMMVLFVFPSLAHVTYVKGHVRTDILYERFSRRKRGALDIISTFFSIGFMLLLSWQLGARALNIIEFPPGPATSYFQWPHLPFIILATVCCALMCLELFIWFVESLKQAVGK